MRFFPLFLGFVLCLLPVRTVAGELELRFGLDQLTRKQSDITGLHQLALTYRGDHGFYVGQSLYSSALGSGGGFFAGGVELGHSGRLGSKLLWDVGQFVGGGGGASQVDGNGLMLRTHASLQFPIGDLKLGLGAAWITVSGSDIRTPAVNLYLSQPLDLRISPGRPGAAAPRTTGSEIKAFRPFYAFYQPLHSDKRAGGELGRMHLIGGEVTFGSSADDETFLQASGVVAGDAEGYADWFIGKRYRLTHTPLQPFVELGIGTAGGGAVDTDGGLVVMAGAGARYAFERDIALEAGLGVRSSLEGSFLALAPTLKVSIPFAATAAAGNDPPSVPWQLRTGLALQHTNPGYWKDPAHADTTPVLFETGLNFFITEHFYLTGQAATAVHGDAGGYQQGLLGIGYQQDLGEMVSLALEPLVGAGGGAGVDTGGGLLIAYRLNVDLWLSRSAALTLGFGQVAAARGDGMCPQVFQVGLKIPFSSWH